MRGREAKRGVTGTTVAAALFWLPGLTYTYYHAGQASQLVSEHKSHLTALYNKQACSGNGLGAPAKRGTTP